MSDLPFLNQLGDELADRARRDEAMLDRRGIRMLGRWRMSALAAAFGVAVVAVAAIGLDGGTPSVAERAYAAASPQGKILHTVEDILIRSNGDRARAPAKRRHPRAEPLVAAHQRIETWSDGTRRRSVIGEVEDGTVVPTSETASSGESVATYVFALNALLRPSQPVKLLGGRRHTDPIEVFRQLYRQGKIEAAGETTLDGRTVKRLTMHDPGQQRTWLVDPETFQPLRYRITVGDSDRPRFQYTVRYLTYERLERTAENERHLRMSPHPDAKVLTRPLKPTDLER